MKYIRLLGIALALFFLGYIVVASLFVNQSSLPMAEARYNQKVQEKCLAEKNLAHAKAQEWANNKLELSPDDLIRLNDKKEMDCAVITPVFK
jgi:hypothetical protein